MPSESSFLFETAFGHAGIVFAPEPFILRQIILPHPDKQHVLRRMGGKPARICGDPPAQVRETAAVIRAYFAGGRIAIPWQWLDMNQFSPAKQMVYRQVARIPYGEVRSYRHVAIEIGRTGAARFVGNCMAANPYPILVPCHRVIRSDGGLGGFGGGLALKQRMLDLEAGRP